jgi:selenide,water dikinase
LVYRPWRSELARGAALKMQIQLDQVPLLPGVLGHRQTKTHGRFKPQLGAQRRVSPADISVAAKPLQTTLETSGGNLLVKPAPGRKPMQCWR